jgi:hypothetical protein
LASVTINLPDERAAALKAPATAQGLTLEGWFERLVEREVPTGQLEKAQAAAARIREIQKRSMPDPDGWIVHDYIARGRP